MSFLGKMKDIFVAVDEDYEEDAPENFQHEEKENSVMQSDDRLNYEFETDSRKNDNKVVNIHATTQLQVILVKPEQFEDASTVADYLNAKKTVVLNLESATKELSRRLIDFLSGVAYANNGQIKRVANSTFIITPYNVDIKGDLLDELENNGVYF